MDILEYEGHEVAAVSNGMQGLDSFKGKDFDLVCTDLGMSGMSGWQVVEEIKHIGKKVFVAIITGWAINLIEPEMREKGGNLSFGKRFK